MVLPALLRAVCSSTEPLLPLQLPLRLLYEVFFVSPRFFSPRALFLRSCLWLGSSSRFPFSSPLVDPHLPGFALTRANTRLFFGALAQDQTLKSPALTKTACID
jgi:hypothetical protein